MQSRLRRAGIAMAAALALLPGAASAMHLSSADRVLIRYHFTAGAQYAYRIGVDMHISVSAAQSSAASTTETAVLNGTLRYHILSVDTSGGATALVSEDHLSETSTVGGATASVPVKSEPARTVYLGADGSERGTGSSQLGDFAAQTLGSLPVGAVAPGMRWNSAAAVSVPSSLGSTLAPMHMTAQYLFSKIVTAHGQRAAAIDSNGSLQYVSDGAYMGQPMHMHLNAVIAGQELFGLSVARPVQSQSHMDMRVFISAKGASAAVQSINEHVVIAISMQPLGW